MTDKEITDFIDDMYSGDWGRSHEWETKYDRLDQIKMIHELFTKWDYASEVGKELIAGTLCIYVTELWCGFQNITPVIIQHAKKNQVVNKMLPLFVKGLFCDDLLREMDKNQINIASWTEEIKKRWTEKSFREDIHDTNLAALYTRIGNLLEKVETYPALTPE
ncbi:MAG: hypothetical protein IAE67_09405 [Candidatus Competibacteraceae bacterium]|nr:hypothetical protein [Candidatus Competibacteraceae bacterium]